MTNEELIARAEASLTGVTPGTWEYRPDKYDDWGVVKAGKFVLLQARHPDRLDDETLAEWRSKGADPWEPNARFIAASRQNVPDLIAALRASEAHAKAGWALATHWQNRYTERAVADDAALRALKGGAK